MTKQEVASRITKQTGIEKETVLAVMEEFMEQVRNSLIDGEPVYLRGFGSFIIKQRAEKMARNISKNTAVVIPAHPIPAFKPAPAFMKAVKEAEIK